MHRHPARDWTVKPQIGQIWRNQQDQKPYRVLGLVINATSAQVDQKMVLYESVEWRDYSERFVREEREFIENFEEPLHDSRRP